MANDERKLLKKKTKYANEDNYLSLAETCQRLGEIYKDREEYQRALNEYKLAAKAYEKLNRTMDRGLAYRMIGEMHLMMGQFKEALLNVQAHMRAARKEANQLEVQRASVTLGRVYLHRADNYQLEKKTAEAESDLVEAEKSFQMGLSLCTELQRTVRKTELVEMQAGTYLNLGVTLDRRGKTDDAQEHMERAIRLAREADLFDLLHTCYNTMALSCSQWERKDGSEHHGKTLRLLNHGLEVASRLSNRATKMCQTLLLKAEFFLQMGDFQSARQTLKRAWHLKTPISGDAKQIAQQLKVLVALCRTEDELITVDATNFAQRKALYERMGDGACKLRNFAKAIDYYRRMLQCSEALGETNRQLLPCYVSLYQTYNDNQQYELALEYMWKEYEIIADEPKEAYHTLLQIAKLYERVKKSFFDIDDIYRRAREEARKLQSVELERTTVQRAVKLLRANCMDLMADNLEQEAVTGGIDLSIVEPDSEELPDTDEQQNVDDEENEEEQNTPNVGDDIDLHIDLSDNSDVEGEANMGGGIGGGQKINTSITDGSNAPSSSTPGRLRKRGMTFAVRRNNKGETQLHQAAIAGNKVLVERLLEQGHPVNVRDHAGWLPLHEACIHGHVEIVSTLLDRGAHLNDKGGTSCDGITPLYDACCNGRLEVIELLLVRGANATHRTDFGDTTLNVLDTWFAKRRARLSPDEIAHYERVRGRLATKFDAAAVHIPSPVSERTNVTKVASSGGKSSTRRRVSSSDSDPPTDQSSCASNPFSSKRKLQRCTGSGSSGYGSMGSVAPTRHRNMDSGSDSEKSDWEDAQVVPKDGGEDRQRNPAGVSEYRSTMEALRKNKITEDRRHSLPSSGQKKRLAHMTTDEVDADEWLIDDLQQAAKRSRVSGGLPRSSSGFEREKSSSSFQNLPSPEAPEVDAIFETYDSPAGCLSSLLDADDDDSFADSQDDDDHNDGNKIATSAFNVLMKNSAKSFRRIVGRRGSSESRANLVRSRRHSSGAQSSLIDAGFQRVSSPSFDEKENLTPPEIQQQRTPVKSSPSAPSAASDSSQKSPAVASPPKQSFNIVLDNGKTVDLCFDDQSLFSTRTIGWLQNEIARRYTIDHGKRPTVKIQQSADTAGLCAFSDAELLNVLTRNRLPNHSTGITVYCQVRGYADVNFGQFYDDRCLERNIENDKDLRTRLVQMERTGSIVLEPDFVQTVPSSPFPVAETLSLVFLLVFFQQDWLNHLDLSVNGITDKDMETLARYLPSCHNLRVLRLSLNMLTSQSVRMLCDGVEDSTDKQATNGSATLRGLRGSLLEELDLSHNPLGDAAIPSLIVLCNELPKLRILCLQSTDITAIDETSFFAFDISRLETFDASQNRLAEQSVHYILESLANGCIREARFHSLAVLCNGFKEKLWRTITSASLDFLVALNLANCRLLDDEIESSLLPALGKHCDNLIHLDLSYNIGLTKRTFLAVLRQCNGAFHRLEQVHFLHDAQLWDKLHTVSQAELLESIEYNPSVHYPHALHAMLPVCGETSAQQEVVLALIENFWRTLWGTKPTKVTKLDDGLHVTLSIDV